MTNSRISRGRIFMIDDNRTDILLMQRALAKADAACEFSSTPDGEAAMEILRAGPNRSEPFRPDLILLDLNMPRKDGFQVLKELKQDPELLEIPVVIYSSSTRPEDARRCYALHANSYISKPMSYENLIETANLICSYWFQSVLPIH